MLKSDAERIVRRAIEESEAVFTEEQILALSQMILKIAGRVVEEAASSWTNKPGSKASYFAD